MSASYAFWQAMLRGESPEFPVEPQCGFFRIPASKVNPTGNVQRRVPASSAVGVWEELTWVRARIDYPNGFTFSVRSDEGERWHKFVGEVWPRCAIALQEEQYRAWLAMSTRTWPGESEAVSEDNARVGHNMLDNPDTFEDLQMRIDRLAMEAEALIKKGAATSEAAKDEAADIANRLGQLQKLVEKKHKAEKKPHDDAISEIKAKWKPLEERASIYMRLKQIVCKPWMDRDEEEKKKLRHAHITTGGTVANMPQDIAKPTTAGSRGRTVTLRTIKSAEIVDQDALYQAVRTNRDVMEALQKVATAAVRAGLDPLPGTRLKTETQAA